MGKVKDFLMDVEEMLSSCLTDDGMTNDQALKYIEDKLGRMGRAYAYNILISWNKGDDYGDS
tara:strand:+ start:299 stop:484 length:186 start_codon:yes stop_codon:yes gene_type:complete